MLKLKYIEESYWQFHAQVAIIGDIFHFNISNQLLIVN